MLPVVPSVCVWVWVVVFFTVMCHRPQKIDENKPKLSTHCVDLFSCFTIVSLFCYLNMGRIFSKNAWHVNSLFMYVVCFPHTIILSMYTKLSLLITQCVSV